MRQAGLFNGRQRFPPFYTGQGPPKRVPLPFKRKPYKDKKKQVELERTFEIISNMREYRGHMKYKLQNIYSL
jgi:hypothetical protein